MKNNITGSSVYRFPPELWLQILQLVAFHPTADEFASSIGTSSPFSWKGDNLTTYIGQEEVSELIKQRSTLATVCRTWHPIANALLWSHLRLSIGISRHSLEHVLKTIHSKPYLASIVKRLSICSQTGSYHGWEGHEASNEVELRRLLDHLTCLRVITYPSIYQLTGHLPGLHVASIYYGKHTGVRKSKPHFLRPSHVYHQLRMLALDLNNMEIPHGLASFPLLETVHLTLTHHYHAIYNLTRWSMPRLRFVSLKSTNSSICESFLLAVKPTLEYLKIDLGMHERSLIRPREVFPRLHSLFIPVGHGYLNTRYALGTIRHLIVAPQLHCVGFYDIHDDVASYEIDNYMATAFESYPTVDTFHLQGSTPDGSLVSEKTTDDWRKRGVQIHGKPDNS